MLPKEVDWVVLSQCDAYAVKRFVETQDRPAVSMITPMSERLFDQKLRQDDLWRRTYEILCSSYKKLQNVFSIVHDQFGGYRLVYSASDEIKVGTILRRSPVGFLKSIPDGVSDLSIMRSEQTGFNVVLLGPVRCINSDCDPNCEYDFSSDVGIVQIRVKKKLQKGDEIFVKYGDDFFATNQCKCRSCNAVVSKTAAFESIIAETVDDLIIEVAFGVMEDLNNVPAPNKRKRISKRSQLEHFDDVCGQFNPTITLEVQSSNHSLVPINKEVSNSEIKEDEILEPVFEVVNACGSNVCETEVSHDCSKEITVNGNPMCSSPLPVYSFCEPPSFSAVNLEDVPPFFVANSVYPSRDLYENSRITVNDAVSLTEMFCSRFNLSDVASNSLYTLLNTFLPEENFLPTGYSFLKKMRNNLLDNQRFHDSDDKGTYCVLNFRAQIDSIVGRNIKQILDYGLFRQECPESDLNLDLAPPVRIIDNSININLVLFTVGVNIKKSTVKNELWPIWLQVADLPPVLRMSRKNTVLASLFVGSGYPNWSLINHQVHAELSGAVHCSTTDLNISYNVRLLISDLGAMHHLLNMYKFNGFYGCHVCLVEGKTIGRTHAYYPFGQEGELREPEVHENHVLLADCLNRNGINVAGVKGKRAFSNIVHGLSLTAPIDYMHCILLGVFPDILRRLNKSLTTNAKKEVNDLVAGK